MNYVQQLQSLYDPREARAIYMMVMEEAFRLSPTDVLLDKDKELSADDKAKLQNIMARLLNGEPVQYALGHAHFCQHDFHVEPGVLIPRPETELLVQTIIGEHHSPTNLLDIGTGSGCIAISLALAGHQVTAFDISDDALRIASGNAASLHADVRFRHEDILHPTATGETWEVIVSNPPYICHSEAKDMERNVLEHEPHLALFVPDESPLLFYEAIAEYSLQHLTEGGSLYFECNRAFAHDVAMMLNVKGFYNTRVIDDQYGNPRIATGTLSCKAQHSTHPS